GGFAAEKKDYHVEVEIPQEILEQLPEDKREALLGVLSQDPRPAYQEDPERIYGLVFAGYDIHFRVSDGVLTVHSIKKAQ
ncbi:MAG: tRNA (N6-threonylcarbamoyladenosine(37)-N6)-methyltransferase TrmO, partial [Oscillospiraceae bacterium]|nr:tRNA (N6-threonylcarbamoyladenosine(37)-N6)-methyltransferase TrmO [Oscillospiraceae bacterium]